MKTFLLSAFAVAFLAMGVQNARAMDTMMPKCAMGDPVVGVNTTTKMYLTQAQMKMKMAGMSSAQSHAMMMKNHVKMMCLSQAKTMGAKAMMH